MKNALLTVLLGTTDPGSSLYALRLFRKTLIPIIWRMVDSFVWAHLSFETSAVLTVQGWRTRLWPEPHKKPLNVNMMPFRMGRQESLPSELLGYWNLIDCCLREVSPEGREEIGYVSVHETFVLKGGSQRRGGLHIETPGALLDTAIGDSYTIGWGVGERTKHHLVGGELFVVSVVPFQKPFLFGGIFFGSTMSNSCAIWPNVLVVDPHVPGVVGAGGSCEHLREYLGPGARMMNEGELWWMTDRTPHEALPQEKEGWRQFFRLVVGKVTVWYSKHNTPNPLCELPPDVRVIDEDKFANYETQQVEERPVEEKPVEEPAEKTANKFWSRLASKK